MKKIYKLAQIFKKAQKMQPLSNLLAILRAAAHIHQTHHWKTNGKEYYADHLLFERLYNDGADVIDQIAERAVGAESAGIGALEQVNTIGEIVREIAEKTPVNSSDDMVKRSLAIENMVLETIKEIKDNINDLTPGTSALLDNVADLHETFVYLLKSRNKD
jgi:DNA-binding ferritin-like protein